MPRATWPLTYDRPVLEIVLTLAQGRTKTTRTLLADTGAGNVNAPFELLLDENDCLLCGGQASQMVPLTGSFAGPFPLYLIRVEITQLGIAGRLRAIGVPAVPSQVDGIACFPFINRFTYGNFGNPSQFGLET